MNYVGIIIMVILFYPYIFDDVSLNTEVPKLLQVVEVSKPRGITADENFSMEADIRIRKTKKLEHE